MRKPKENLSVCVWVALGWVSGSALANAQDLSANPVDDDGFRIAAPGYEYSFPGDHGSHPLYKIEWWYLTGHFRGKNDDRLAFGFQATFFRFAQLNSGRDKAVSLSINEVDQLYLSHMALVDKSTGAFLHEERFQRENWDASAMVGDLNVYNGNWSLRRDESLGHPEAMRLTGSVLAEARFSFELSPAKPRVIFGQNGVSRKGDAESAASLYITFPRLHLNGTIEWEGKRHEVSGLAWMDHEISSSQLDEDQVGWDWASIQLNDGREIMMYLMRTKSGDYDSWSKLYWIDRNGKLSAVPLDAFEWIASDSWTSEMSGATYPQDFTLEIPSLDTRQQTALRLKPVTSNQEIHGRIGGINYWEGACDVLDENGTKIGQAYVELAGYDGQLSGRLR